MDTEAEYLTHKYTASTRQSCDLNPGLPDSGAPGPSSLCSAVKLLGTLSFAPHFSPEASWLVAVFCLH